MWLQICKVLARGNLEPIGTLVSKVGIRRRQLGGARLTDQHDVRHGIRVLAYLQGSRSICVLNCLHWEHVQIAPIETLRS